MHVKEQAVNSLAFYASWANPTPLSFAVVWMFIVDISSVFLYFFRLFAGCYVKLCCVLKRWFKRINQMFLLGWFFSLGEQRMNLDPVTLNTIPSFLTHSPSHGGEVFSSPNQHLGLDTEREGDRINFLRCPACVHCSQAQGHTGPQIQSQGKNSFFFSGFFGSLRGRGE